MVAKLAEKHLAGVTRSFVIMIAGTAPLPSPELSESTPRAHILFILQDLYFM
jgi:hypothetical protein